jgi:hypothetical protein
MENQTKSNEICCPEFDPKPWDGHMHEWNEKLFIRDKVFTIFHMPMNFGAAMRRFDRKVTAAGAQMPDWLCLSDHTSMWNMDLYLCVDKNVAGAENMKLSGKYFSKVFEGPYKDAGKWQKEFASVLKDKNLKPGKTFTWYTTCPKCAKKFGKNYVVLFAELN